MTRSAPSPRSASSAHVTEARASKRRYLRGEAAGRSQGCRSASRTSSTPRASARPTARRCSPTTSRQRDAEAVRRAREAGAILVGKTQTHEFAWGITSVNPLMGSAATRGRRSACPGGSSGGSAVALAAARSCRSRSAATRAARSAFPSGFCGTVGLKPTYGRISARGRVSARPLARPPGADGADAGGRRAPARGDRRRRPRRSRDRGCPARRPRGTTSGGAWPAFVSASARIFISSALAPDIEAVFDSVVTAVEAARSASSSRSALPRRTGPTRPSASSSGPRRSSRTSQAGLFPARRDEYGDGRARAPRGGDAGDARGLPRGLRRAAARPRGVRAGSFERSTSSSRRSVPARRSRSATREPSHVGAGDRRSASS